MQIVFFIQNIYLLIIVNIFTRFEKLTHIGFVVTIISTEDWHLLVRVLETNHLKYDLHHDGYVS